MTAQPDEPRPYDRRADHPGPDPWGARSEDLDASPAAADALSTAAEPKAGARWGVWDRIGAVVIAALLAVLGVVVVTEASKGPTSLELAAWHEAGHAVIGDLAPDECGIVIQRLHVTREGSGAVNFSRDDTRSTATGECQWADLLLVVAGEEAGNLYADLQASPEQAASDKSSALELVELLKVSRPAITVNNRPVDFDAETATILAVARSQARQLLDEHRPAVQALAEAVVAENSLNLGRERIRTIIDGAS